MGSLSTTTFANALKVLYPKGLEYLWYPQSPFLGVVKKTYDFYGASKQINPVHAGSRGSNTFSTANSSAGKTYPLLGKFNVTRVKSYVIGLIDNEAILAAKNDTGAVARAIDAAIKSATYEFGRALAHQVWGNSGGSRGQVGSVSGTDLTLSNANDVVKFEVGMEVEASATDGTSGSVRSGTATITAIDRSTGVLTSDSNWTTQISGLVANDYLFREGDFGNCAAGVLGWVPTSAPTSGDSWFGFDRSVDVARYSGHRVSASGAPLEEVVMDACAEAMINGAQPDLLVLNPKRGAELRKNLHAKSLWTPNKIKSSDALVSFAGFQFAGPAGAIQVLEEPMCPYAYALLTERGSWELSGLGQVPHFAMEDGNRFLRDSSSDAIEFRLKAYFNLLCHRPVGSVLITL